MSRGTDLASGVAAAGRPRIVESLISRALRNSAQSRSELASRDRLRQRVTGRREAGHGGRRQQRGTSRY